MKMKHSLILICKKFIYFSIFLAVLLSNPNTINAQSFKPKVTVGTSVLTSYDVSQKRKLLTIFYGRDFSEQDSIDVLINEVIKLQYAQKKGIQISETFLKEKTKNMLNKVVNGKPFAKLMKNYSIETEYLFDIIKSNYYWSELIKKEFKSALVVSEKELIETRPQVTKVIKPRILTSLIFIPYKIRGKENTITLISRLRNELEQGAKFSILARRFSKDASSTNGGSLGWKELSQFNEPVRSELARTNIGETTVPLMLSDGVYLFLVQNRRNKIKPKEINMIFNYAIIDKSINPEKNCSNINEETIVGPVLSTKLNKNVKTLLESMKVGEQKYYNVTSNIVLCSKELNLTEGERVNLATRLQSEKLNRLSEGLYLRIRQNSIVIFHEN